jgi:hypothetical protein
MPSYRTTAFLFPEPDACARNRRKHDIMRNNERIHARGRNGNAHHHLWNNHGTFWCHFTLHLPDYTKRRVRLALGTRDFGEARELRDGLLHLFGPLLATVEAAQEEAA